MLLNTDYAKSVSSKSANPDINKIAYIYIYIYIYYNYNHPYAEHVRAPHYFKIVSPQFSFRTNTLNNKHNLALRQLTSVIHLVAHILINFVQ